MPMPSGRDPTGFENFSRRPGATSANGIRNATIPGRARKATMAFGSSAFIGSPPRERHFNGDRHRHRLATARGRFELPLGDSLEGFLILGWLERAHHEHVANGPIPLHDR